MCFSEHYQVLLCKQSKSQPTLPYNAGLTLLLEGGGFYAVAEKRSYAPSLKTVELHTKEAAHRSSFFWGEKKGFFSSSLEILLSAASENAICIHGSRPFPDDGRVSSRVCSPLLRNSRRAGL